MNRDTLYNIALVLAFTIPSVALGKSMMNNGQLKTQIESLKQEVNNKDQLATHQLQSINKESELELQNLTRQIEQLNSELVQTAEKLSLTLLEKKQIEAELQQCKHMMDAMQRDFQEGKTQISTESEAKDKLNAETLKKVSILESQLGQVETAHQTLLEQYNQLSLEKELGNERISQLVTELEQTKVMYHEKQMENEDLNRKYSALYSADQEQLAEMNQLRQTIQDLVGKSNVLQEQHKTQLEELTQKYEQDQEAAQLLHNEKWQELNAQNELLAKENAELKQQLEEAKTQIANTVAAAAATVQESAPKEISPVTTPLGEEIRPISFDSSPSPTEEEESTGSGEKDNVEQQQEPSSKKSQAPQNKNSNKKKKNKK